MPAMLMLLTLLIAWALQGFTSDDPFITYRYAHNLVLGQGMVYNPGERVLSTTAPFYALLLAVGAFLGVDLPTLSNWLGALGFGAASVALFELAEQDGRFWTGLGAALLCLSSPLLWMTLGFEIGLYVASVCWAFWALTTDRGRVCAILLALATLLRGDGIVAAGVATLVWWVKRRRIPWRYLPFYALPVGIGALWLTLQYGSPLPVTLRAKTIQARFGLTGFYTHTSFLQGGFILWWAWSRQTFLYWMAPLLASVGIVALRRTEGLWGLTVWGTLMMAAYVVLGVAPYQWYYAPLAPALSLLIGLGAEAAGQRIMRPKWSGFLALGLTLPLIVAQGRSLSLVVAALQTVPPPPEEIASKVLPEAKTTVYRRVGEWLAVNTPPTATVGALEVGIIGYYSDRTIVDFLGLLQPDIARALERGDIFWAVAAYAPDYLVLTEVNPLYTYPLRDEDWFRRAYRPVALFYDSRFWGSPVTVYRRIVAAPQPKGATVERPITDSATLVAWATDGPLVRPGMPLRVRLTWRLSDQAALDNTLVSVYLVDSDWHLAGQRVLRYHTSTWAAGEEVEVYHTLVLADDFPAGRYGLHLRVEDDAGEERFEDEIGWLKRPPSGSIPPEATPLNVEADFANLAGYTLSAPVRAGQPLTLTLYWVAQAAAERDWTVFVHLLDGSGGRIAQADGPPFDGRYPTTAWGAGEVIPDRHVLQLPDPLPAGPHCLLVGLYDWSSGERMELQDAAGRPLPERAVTLEVH